MYTFKKSVPVTTFVTEEVETTLVEYIGLTVRTKREAMGIDQVTLAAKTVVVGQNDYKPLLTSCAISRIESGCKDKPESYPNLKSLEILANVLNIHITELFPPKPTE